MTYEEAYRQFYPLLVKLVNDKKQPNSQKNDLLQVARIGLSIALDKHDPERGPLYNTVQLYVNKELFNFVNQHSRTIRLPENVIYDKERDKFPTEYMDSLDDTLFETGEPIYSIIPYEENLDMPEENKVLKTLLNCLNENDRYLIESYYMKEMTLKEIGLEMGKSKERVRQLIDKAIGKLQSKAGVEIKKVNKRYNKSTKVSHKNET